MCARIASLAVTCLMVVPTVLTRPVMAQPAASQPSGPAPTEPLPKDLPLRLVELSRQLPGLNAAVTPEQRAQAVKACEVYRAAAGRVSELDEKTRMVLGAVGLSAGYAAGDADTMLGGAELYWQHGGQQSAGAQVLVWAGIFAGKPDPARKGLEFLSKQDENWAEWAKGMAAVAAGCDKPVDATFTLLDGKPAKLSDYRGKAVVLDFWATWCGPCVRVMPVMKKFQAERKDDANFVLVSLSLDDKVDDARRGVTQHQMTWTQGMGQGVDRAFGVKEIPHVIVLSPAGRILWRGHPVAEQTMVMTSDFARRQAAWLAEKKSAGPPASPPPSKPPEASGQQPAKTASPEAEEEARQKYSLYRTYRKAGVMGKAKEILLEIVEKYPDTQTAKQAKEDLKTMY